MHFESGGVIRPELQHVRRLAGTLVDRLFAEVKTRGERPPIRISPTVTADMGRVMEKRSEVRSRAG
jgi:hypothetical protein